MNFQSFLICIFLYCTGSLNAQDSLKIDQELSIITRGQHNLSALVNNLECLHCDSGTINDNPFFHLAVYTGLDHSLILNDKYEINTGLYLEQRSYSGGNNTLSNLVVYPKILMTVKDTLSLKNHKLGIQIKGGDFWDEEISDIIRFYNLDYHALQGAVQIGNWEFSFMTIGDLFYNVGLDLPQTYRFATRLRKNKINTLSSFTINELVSSPIGTHPTDYDLNLDQYLDYIFSPSIKLSAQLSMRVNDVLSNSIATALKADFTSKYFTFEASLRYFSSNYNIGYNGNQPRYISPRGAYIGEQLYPLRNFYRPFSQWAAYTHFTTNEMLALGFRCHYDKKLYRKLGIFTDLDFNYLSDLDQSIGELYPFYQLGIEVFFVKNFKAIVSTTNRQMDLSKFYQGLAASKSPFISLGFLMKIENLTLKTKRIKI